MEDCGGELIDFGILLDELIVFVGYVNWVLINDVDILVIFGGVLVGDYDLV